jgi:hypothetical protein
MKRLAFLFAAMALSAQTPVSDPFAIPNSFAVAYNEWGKLYEQRVTAVGELGVNLQEKRAFDQLTKRWNDLRKYERGQY